MYCSLIFSWGFLLHLLLSCPNVHTLTAPDKDDCLQSLLTLVSNEMANDNCKQDASLQKVYNNTLDHIRAQQAQEGEVGSRYQGLQVS